ncbi:hypothetical protein BLA29_011654 [Euroglyphus maynei]|uniref:Uncharacterized protein n=1 Tax=Euroglyphus maynei TaxID=6958 RepID=A0A1Y3BPR1_EURMA|nr:hypothetical protein BLA29_011654 [Euroglyphus maynei]
MPAICKLMHPFIHRMQILKNGTTKYYDQEPNGGCLPSSPLQTIEPKKMILFLGVIPCGSLFDLVTEENKIHFLNE